MILDDSIIMNKVLQRVLIMAGGTGGHVFPGLALANYLRDQGIEVHWLGTQRGLEAQCVPSAGITFHVIKIGGLRGKNFKTLLLAPFKILTALYQSCRILYRIQPNMVIGMGGFVSGPGGVASWLLGYPLIIHEQNAKAGFTNKILAKFSKKILEGFPAAFKRQSKVVSIGNPVRLEIEQLPPPQTREAFSASAPLRLLVLGGSLGAQAINELMPQALKLLPADLSFEVRHQTGQKHDRAAHEAYAAHSKPNINFHLTPFIEDMAENYAWANLVLCRAGALTIAELCAAGLGAILIPFPYAVDDHQTANADFMVRHHAALCCQQSAMNAEKLAVLLKDFAESPEKRLNMAKAAYELRCIGVSEKIFDILCAVAVNK